MGKGKEKKVNKKGKLKKNGSECRQFFVVFVGSSSVNALFVIGELGNGGLYMSSEKMKREFKQQQR